tara:strand:- start:2300 stop:3031 length:732 start_codon:yes stop_codon:yes gene_type:complete
MHKRIIKGIPRYVFDNEEEFRESFPDAKLIENWRDGQINDWVLTDDGKVTQVLKKKTMKNTSIKSMDDYFVTLLGPCFASGKMQGQPKKDFNSFKKRDIEEKPLTWREIRFVKMVAHGEAPIQAYLECFETNNKNTASVKSSLLLKQTRILEEVEKEIEELLNDIGVDKKWTLEKARDIVDNPDTSDAVKLRALENFMKIQSMYPKEKKSEQLLLGQAFTGFSKEEILQLSGVKQIESGEQED